MMNMELSCKESTCNACHHQQLYQLNHNNNNLQINQQEEPNYFKVDYILIESSENQYYLGLSKAFRNFTKKIHQNYASHLI